MFRKGDNVKFSALAVVELNTAAWRNNDPARKTREKILPLISVRVKIGINLLQEHRFRYGEIKYRMVIVFIFIFILVKKK